MRDATRWWWLSRSVALEEEWRSARWRKPDSETVPKWWGEVKQTRWLTRTVLHDYCEVEKVWRLRLNWVHFTSNNAWKLNATDTIRILCLLSGLENKIWMWKSGSGRVRSPVDMTQPADNLSRVTEKLPGRLDWKVFTCKSPPNIGLIRPVNQFPPTLSARTDWRSLIFIIYVTAFSTKQTYIHSSPAIENLFFYVTTISFYCSVICTTTQKMLLVCFQYNSTYVSLTDLD